MLRILAGEERPDSGRVHYPPNFRIGYLPQGFHLDLETSVGEVINRAAGNLDELNRELAISAVELSKDPHNEEIADHYDELLRRIRKTDRAEAEAEAILARLGLAELEDSTPLSYLSGGQRTRLALALVLLSDPHILLLDEPTNHLDIEMLEWLEDWLAHTSCGALIVSHDRTFLDRTVTRILALDTRTHTIKSYDGNYSAYLQQRRTAFEKRQAQYSDQQAEERRIKEDIAKAKAQAAKGERQMKSVYIGGRETKNSKDFYRRIAKKVAKKAKSREKKLERYLDSGERIDKPKEDRSLYFEFQQVSHLGKSVIQLEDLSVGYREDAPLLEGINLQVRASQRIAVTGPNGRGKTTLLRTIMGKLPPLGGRVVLGKSVRIGMMSQDLATLKPEKTPVENGPACFSRPNRGASFFGDLSIGWR